MVGRPKEMREVANEALVKTHVPLESCQDKAVLEKNHVQPTFECNLRLVTFNWYEGRAKSSGTIMCMYRGARRPKNLYYV